jgi:hypothetical protein
MLVDLPFLSSASRSLLLAGCRELALSDVVTDRAGVFRPSLLPAFGAE